MIKLHLKQMKNSKSQEENTGYKEETNGNFRTEKILQ